MGLQVFNESLCLKGAAQVSCAELTASPTKSRHRDRYPRPLDRSTYYRNTPAGDGAHWHFTNCVPFRSSTAPLEMRIGTAVEGDFVAKRFQCLSAGKKTKGGG